MDDALIQNMLAHPVELERAFAIHMTSKAGAATPRQAALLNFIVTYTSSHGSAPSFGQMADGIGARSKATVMRLLDGLEERGLVKRLPKRPRSLTILAGLQ